MMQTILHRHGPPNKYDSAPYKSLCRVEKGVDYEIYVQTNHFEEEEPTWKYVGKFSAQDKSSYIVEEAEKHIHKRYQ